MTIARNKTSNRYCGPAALAALTGIHVDDAARTLRAVSGKTAIKGVADRFMQAALERLGYRAAKVEHDTLADRRIGRRPTLTQVLAGALKGRPAAQRYLVLITGHYVTIQGRRLVDNKHPEGIALTDCPYRRHRVRRVWAIEAVAPVAPPPRPPRGLSYNAFCKAVEAMGLDTSGYMVIAPPGFTFADGLHGRCLYDQDNFSGALVETKAALPLQPCPPDCDCQE